MPEWALNSDHCMSGHVTCLQSVLVSFPNVKRPNEIAPENYLSGVPIQHTQ